jgi:hypothetical protein
MTLHQSVPQSSRKVPAKFHARIAIVVNQIQMPRAQSAPARNFQNTFAGMIPLRRCKTRARRCD